jgi:penicillin amidase
MGRALLVVGIIFLVIALIVAGVGTWYARRPWPQVSGSIEVEGLSAPVEVVRDEWGVPHIYAEDEHDLFFAQGYVHAQDRLWQMEFNRRVGGGTLSAALGEATVDTDRFLRTIGLRRAAEKDWALLDGDTRAIVEAYAEGVNAFIETHRNRLPLEFTILGVDPEPWTPVDSVAWAKVMGLGLCANYDMELLRAQIIAHLGEEAAQTLMPPYAEGAPVIVPAEADNFSWLRASRLNGLQAIASVLGAPGAGRGSNNWVVHGSRTATGMPLLADDTHLDLDMPSVWYENGLHGGRFDSVGFSFPGVPAVVIGHNGRVAWGVTNLPADVQDFYIEKLDDPEKPTQYEFEGRWQDLQIVPEMIEVKGGEPVTIEVLLTHHGPIMNDVLGDLEDAEPLALRWTALEGNYILRALWKINLATNWEEFRAALRDWDAPTQNFVYADMEGNIGYQTPGMIPIRAPGHQGLVPVPGWTGEYEWQGFVRFEELPSVFNPPVGFIATANNKVISDDYPYHLAYEWSPPYRAQRIVELLAGSDSVTVEDMQALQAQTYGIPAEALRSYLLALDPEGDLEARALALAGEWDLYYEVDRPGASVFQVWYWYLVQYALGDELGDELMGQYRGYGNLHVPLMIELMAQPDNVWFDDVNTPQVETRDDIAARSLTDAVAWLRENHGEGPEAWEWGRLHTKTFIHQPLGQSGIGPLEELFNGKTVLARGDNFTVDAAWFDYNDAFAMSGGSSQRFIADLGDLGNSLTMHTTGQSGHLFHRHREDFIEPWQEVRHHPTLFSREMVDRYSADVLTLMPAR